MPSPPSFVVFGRSPFSSMVLPWHLLALRLARAHRVVYVLDPERSARALRASRPEAGPGGVAVVRLLDGPLQRFGTMRRATVRSAVGRIRRALGDAPAPLVCVLYPGAPVEIARALEPDLVVYVATDDFSRLPDRPDEANPRFQAWERDAVGAADLVVPIAEVLEVGRRAAKTTRVRLLPQAYDDELMDGAPRPAPAALARLPRPLLGFAGTVRATRLDVPLVAAAARARPDLGFAFVGPVIEDLGATVAPLRALPNVAFLDCASPLEVPAFVQAFDVAITPYRDELVNRGYYPLKALDALAMGRPVVSTPWAELEELHPHVLFARDAESFLAAVDAQVAAGNSPAAAALRRDAVRPRALTAWMERFENEVGASLGAR